MLRKLRVGTTQKVERLLTGLGPESGRDHTARKRTLKRYNAVQTCARRSLRNTVDETERCSTAPRKAQSEDTGRTVLAHTSE